MQLTIWVCLSQAVSNAVARLKVMFNDELFMRQGRYSLTQRARQLFGPIRQALQLVRNELPSSVFSPESSSACLSLRFAAHVTCVLFLKNMSTINDQAPSVKLHMDAEFDRQLF